MPRRSEKRESRSGRGEPGAILTAALANETVNPETETTEQPVPAEQLDDSAFWTTGPEGELVPNYDATFPTINEGEVVHGTVVRVDKDEVLVDIGYKSEGVIPVAELSIRRSVNPQDEVQVGEEIDATSVAAPGVALSVTRPSTCTPAFSKAARSAPVVNDAGSSTTSE